MFYYNIHNIVTIRSEVILYELEYFLSSEPIHETDLTVYVSKSISMSPGLERKIIMEQKFDSINVKYSEHFGKLGAQFAITFTPKTTEILVNSLIAKSRHVLYVNLVEPILRFIIISKGYLLLHSACIVDRDGMGVLLSAPPDTGKTTTVLKCLKTGFSFLSDDMTILKLPNKALCFPKPMTISSHTYKTATSVSSDATSDNKKEKSWMKLRSIIHSKEGRQFVRKLATYNVPIFTINTIGQMIVRPPKFMLRDLLQGVHIQNETPIQSLYFIEKGEESTISISKTEALQKAIENSDDAFIFPPYRELVKYFSIGGKSSSELLEMEKIMLSNMFDNIKVQVMKSDDRIWAEHLTQVANVN